MAECPSQVSRQVHVPGHPSACWGGPTRPSLLPGQGECSCGLSVQLWGKCAPFLTSPAWPLQRLRSEGASWLKWAVHADLNSRLWLEPGATCENAAERPPLEAEVSLLPPEAALLLGTRPRSLPWDGRFTAGRGACMPLGDPSPSRVTVPGPRPGSWRRSMQKQHRGETHVGFEGRGQRLWGSPCPPAPDLTLHAPLASFSRARKQPRTF